MKPRTIRRLVVAVLAAAAVALGVFGSMATSSATDIDWTSPVNHTVVR
jgi:ABC-type glycerol-3-phosphate transport system substrate-binding protein